MKTHKKNNAQKGSVFLYILIAIALFGALAYSLSRGTKGQSTSNLEKATAKLDASFIIDHGQNLQRGINTLLRNGCSENEISFDQGIVTGYSNSNAPVDETCHMFSVEGSSLTWEDGWFFTTTNHITDLPDTGNTSADLIAFRLNIPIGTCKQINQNLSFTTTDPQSDDIASTTKFQGAFPTSGLTEIGEDWAALAGKTSGCLSSTSGQYDYFHVLSER